MTATTHEDLHSPQLQQDASEQHKPTSPWMWIALIVAMFAAALLWLRHSNQEDVAPAPVGERMLPAPEQAPVADVQQPAARQAAAAGNQRKAPCRTQSRGTPAGRQQQADLPAAALRNGVQGSVIASLNVDARGQVTNAAIVSRSGERSRDLDRAVLSAVQNWKFQPAMHEGRAVASVVRVPVDFRTGQR